MRYLLLFVALSACSDPEPSGPDAGSDADTDADADADADADSDSDADTDAGPVQLLATPTAGPPDDDSVHLVQWLQVRTNVPSTVAVALDDGSAIRDVAFPIDAFATEHVLPLLALQADTTYDVTVTVTGADGSTDSDVLAVATEPLSIPVPDIVLRAGSAADAEPGYTLMAAWSPTLEELLFAVDNDGSVVWAYEVRGEPKSAMLWDDGRVSTVASKKLSVRTMDGTFVALYTDSAVKKGTTLIDDDLHHDAVFPGDGTFWALRSGPVSVPSYPTDVFDLAATEPADILVDYVVHYDESGKLLAEWSLAELLDTDRVGFGSDDLVSDSLYDWSHANAVLPVDDGEAFLVSVRHQDAVVKVNALTSEVEWILANPDGWSPDLDAKRLQPVGALSWPYHAHGVKVDGDLVYLFDNGNDQRTTPYALEPEPGPLYSRVVAYRVDEGAGTVEQVHDLASPPDGPLFSRALGNVQPLPEGHVLGTYSYLTREHGVANIDIGRGLYSTRLLEWDADAETVVWDLSLSGEAADAPSGWLVDRATRVPSLYLGVAEESWR